MRKNNLVKKRTRNFILLIMMLIVIIGVYIYIRNSKAEKLIKIAAKVTDIEEKAKAQLKNLKVNEDGTINVNLNEKEIEETKQRGKNFRGIVVCRACNGTGKDENSWTKCPEKISTSSSQEYCPECNNNTLTIITYNCEICGIAGVGGGCPCGVRIGDLNINHNPIHPECTVCGGTGEVNCDIWIDVIPNYEGWSQSKTITITANSITGFANGSEFKYSLSSSGTVAPSSWEEPYTNGKTFTIDKSEIIRLTGNTTGTGTFYVWVKPLTDPYGFTTGEVVSPALQFDNSAPDLKFNPNENTTYAQSQSATVTVTDVGNGLLGTLKYIWTESEEEPEESSWMYSDEFSNGDTITISKGTGVRYLWISASDSLGNQSTTHSNAFYLDNTVPTIKEVIKSSSTLADAGITLTVIASDSHSGIATTKGYSFDGGETWQNENTKTYNENTKNIQIKVKDNAGNITEYGEIINIDEIESIELKSIEISTIPNKTEYIEGENFDTTGMVVTAIYEDKTSNEITNYIVVDGENLSLEQTSVTIRYTENGVTKETRQEITVHKNTPINIEEYEVKEDEDAKYIKGIETKTTINELKEKINTQGLVEIYKNNQKIEDENTKLGTGMEVIISFTNGGSISYTVVVTGDINGDGDVKASDLSKLKNALIGRTELTGAYKEAADTNGDGNLKASDLSKLKKMIIGQ